MRGLDAAETAEERARRGVRARRGLLAALLALAAAIVMVVGVAIVASQRIDSATSEYVDDTFPLRSRVGDLELAMVNQQTGVRGYILTGDDAALAPYREGRASATRSLAEISSRAAGRPQVMSLLARARREIAALDDYFSRQITLVAAGRPATARADVVTGDRLFGRFRRTAASMMDQAGELIREARADQDARADRLAVILLVIGGAALALAGGLAIAVPRRATRLLDQLDAESAAATRSAAGIARLQSLTAALAAATTTADVARAVLETGRRATGASAGSIALIEPSGESLVTIAMEGYRDEMRTALGSYPIDAPLPVAEAIRSGAVWLSDTRAVDERHPRLAGILATSPYEALAALPLLVDGRPIGGLSLRFAARRSFPQDERDHLTAIADLCAQALDRARLFEAGRREAERQSFLAEAGVLLSTPLEPRAILAQLARLAVPRLADWCTVTASDPTPATVAVAHRDSAKAATATAFAERNPPDLDAPTGVGAVMRTGRSELTPDITPGLIDAALPAGEDREMIRNLGLVSAMSVPLRARGRVLGVLSLISAESGRRFDEDDLRFAEDLGARAGLAVDNAMLSTRSRTIARTLQAGLLPTALPEIDGLEVAARYIAAGDGVEVGGDFYDLFGLGEGEDECADGWAAVLGDVCGKGPEAAALTALARHTIRAEADLLAPSRVLGRLNRAILRQRGDLRFLTANYVWLRRDGGGGMRGVLARGGHPPLLVLRGDGSVEVLTPKGTLVGALETAEFEEQELHLAESDALVLYSDGVVEARSPEGGFFGMERLVSVLAGSRGARAEQIAAAVEDAVGRFQDGRPRDDIALLVLRVVGRTSDRSGSARPG